MRWWLIAAVYQLQHYSQGSERLPFFFLPMFSQRDRVEAWEDNLD
jgi:hypothetical protein